MVHNAGKEFAEGAVVPFRVMNATSLQAFRLREILALFYLSAPTEQTW